MTLERAIMAFAGIMVGVSLILTAWVSPYFVWLTAFIALNMVQSSFTGFCPAAKLLKAVGLRNCECS